MQWRAVVFGTFWWLLLALAGCSRGYEVLSDQRPPTTPAPLDVQAEIRDARYFLPYPDETLAPPSGFQPTRVGQQSPISR